MLRTTYELQDERRYKKKPKEYIEITFFFVFWENRNNSDPP